MTIKNKGVLGTAFGSGNNDTSITLGKNVTVRSFKIDLPTGTGDITYQLFDGAVASAKPITEVLYLAASGSIELNELLTDSSGIVGIRVAGLTNTDQKAYANLGFEL